MRTPSVIAAAVLSLGLSVTALAEAQQGGRQSGAGPQGAGVVGGIGVARGGGPATPAPRTADGRALLGAATLEDAGVWLPVFAVGAHLAPLDTVPFQAWARALYDDRLGHQLEPHARCKASPGVRQFQTPYGVEIVEMADLERVYIFDVGGPHTYRTIYLDGRTHPANLAPSYYGHSIGWWEGDTLVVESTGFNEGFWFDRRGLPTTERLRTVERLTRTALDTIAYEVTIDDSCAYTAPFSARFTLRREPGTELFEYVCQQANYANELMVGNLESVDRTTPIVP